MKPGEWLIKNHVKHLRQLDIITKAIEKYRKNLGDADGVIEQLTLHREQRISAHRIGDPTCEIALRYQDELKETDDQILEQIDKLEVRARNLRSYVETYELIFKSLGSDIDRWFVEQHFVQGESIVNLTNKPFPNERIYSKTYLTKLKRRIIEEVIELAELICFEP